MNTKFHSAGVLSGAYRGADISERTLLSHAVPSEAIKLGRLARAYGEALCNRKIDTVDSGAWEPLAAVDCPACLAILARHGLAVAGPAKASTPAQVERQKTRDGGRYSTMNRCHLCGKGVGHDYYSSSDHNENHGFGLVLHSKCCDRWEREPAKCLALARERGYYP